MAYEDNEVVESFESKMESVNLAEDLKQDQLDTIGMDAKEGYEADRRSRKEWEDSAEEWTKLAKLVREEKSYPWPKSSNVKYPLLATAAMQFAARAYPSLVPSDGRVVKSRVIGKDPDGQKTATAEAVSLYMSYQLTCEMEGWEEDMDKMLVMLPIVGTMFKKTYWDSMCKKFCSKLILPLNLVVNYWATSLADAERISEVLQFNERQVKEKMQSKTWLKIELSEPTNEENARDRNAPTEVDDTTPYQFIEQHTYLDLDEDGYKEPYIVTFHAKTGTVVRIVARYDQNSIHLTDEGELAYISPIQYYTKFGFLPNPEGCFYDIGFGVLLGPINESVNTLINQLVDAGTLRNLQSGFIGKGLRLRMGENRLLPGEWKAVNSTAEDMRKQILPIPANEPSKTLFDLMMALIQSGKELASVAEIFTGKMPGQNTPATTTMASIEQGMKVFTAVYKRIFRSLSEEFKKLYRLDSLYLNPQTYVETLDMVVGPDDFNQEDHRIIPGADPTAVSQTEKLMKAQGLMEMLAAGLPLDPLKVMVRMLEAQEQPNWQELIPPEIMATGQIPPRPDPKMMEMQMKGQMEQAKIQMQGEAQQQKMALELVSEQAKMAMEKERHVMDMQHEADMNNIKAAEADHKQKIFTAQAAAQAEQNIRHNEDTHQQQMRHGDETSKAKVEQTKAQSKAKQSASKGTKK